MGSTTYLKNAWVDWHDREHGAPTIDPKKPYGNANVEEDIARIIGVDLNPHNYNEEKSEEFHESDEYEKLVQPLRDLHRELKTALQIVLSTQSFEPGTYINEGYGIDWKKEE